MKKTFSSLIIFLFLSLIIGGVFFIYNPTFIDEISFPNLLQPNKETLPKTPIFSLFPYSHVENGTIADLEGDASTTKKIVANLGDMKISLYKGTTLINEFDIKSRGRATTFWETPPGAYDVKLKEKNHFSSIGHVWMPYSMHFFGNFFIHGWPYYPDGTEVGEGYSGGCIRLATEDAKIVYEFADVHTPLFILGNSIASTSTEITKDLSPLNLSTDSYIVSDLTTGKIFAQKGIEEIKPLGSLTHLMTAIISLETLNQYPSTQVNAFPAKSNLVAYSYIEIRNLLYPLFFNNDFRAASTLADQVGPKWFVKQMNEKAHSIGLTHTTFTDAIGNSEINTSTPQDLLRLLHYTYTYKSYLTTLSTLATKTTEEGLWTNALILRKREGFKGGFIGKSLDKENAMAVFDIQGHSIGIVLLGSLDATKDIEAILASFSL